MPGQQYAKLFTSLQSSDTQHHHLLNDRHDSLMNKNEEAPWQPWQS